MYRVMEPISLRNRYWFAWQRRRRTCRLLLFCEYRAQFLDLVVGHPLGGHRSSYPFQRAANSVDILDLIRWDLGHVDPVVRPDLDEPVLLEPADGLPNRVPTDTDLLGHQAFIDAFARHVNAFKEGSTQARGRCVPAVTAGR